MGQYKHTAFFFIIFCTNLYRTMHTEPYIAKVDLKCMMNELFL